MVLVIGVLSAICNSFRQSAIASFVARRRLRQSARSCAHVLIVAALKKSSVTSSSSMLRYHGLMFNSRKSQMITADKALRGRVAKMPVAPRHAIHGTSMEPPFPGLEMAMFGMGCFWGAEEVFWLLTGVHSTAVGYAGGFTPNASYEEVCSGLTGHTEVVRVIFDPKDTSYDEMLKAFWEGHDPTQGMRQGADVGTQYRSAIYYYSGDH